MTSIKDLIQFLTCSKDSRKCPIIICEIQIEMSALAHMHPSTYPTAPETWFLSGLPTLLSLCLCGACIPISNSATLLTTLDTVKHFLGLPQYIGLPTATLLVLSRFHLPTPLSSPLFMFLQPLLLRPVSLRPLPEQSHPFLGFLLSFLSC